jgi:F-type H+-transporting ATPase subunit a
MESEIQLTTDTMVFFEIGPIPINATLVFTWITMALLFIAAWWMTRDLTDDPKEMSMGQNIAEMIVEFTQNMLRDIIGEGNYDLLVPFIGAQVLFIAVANLISLVPVFESPTASLSTNLALSISLLLAIPVYSSIHLGVWNYVKAHFLSPSPILMPFTIVSELSRTLSLAMRLYGNIMSGMVMAGVILLVAQSLLPIVVMLPIIHAFGLLTSVLQAYVFAVLSAVAFGQVIGLD